MSTCRRFLPLVLNICVLNVLGLALWPALEARAADRPNIVWLISEDNSIHYQSMFDEHGADTPRIAELAAQGLQFNNAFSNAPVCSVARTTLITGCYAPRIGTQFHRRAVSVPMPDGLKMFPAILRDSGYYTANNNKKDYNADETPGTWDNSSKRATWRAREEGQPFFYMQSFTTTHESSLHFNQSEYETQKTKTDPESVFVAPYHPDTELFRYTVAKYHDNIQRVDQQIGAVVDQLAADGLLEDTFIFYFGDHGGVLPRGKGYAYESGLHVPLVVRIPANWKSLVPWAAGERVDGFVEFVDFGPTVLNLAGAAVPQQMDGKPFLGKAVSANEVSQRDEALGYADRFDEKYDLVRTLRKGKYEYVRSYQPFNFDGLQNNYRYIMLAYRQWRDLFKAGKLNDAQSQFFRARPSEMLFDIEADPYEVNNLAEDPQYSQVLLAMRGRLRDRLKALPDLSFYPESILAEEAFADPVAFGKRHQAAIGRLIDIADLPLQSFSEAESALEAALNSGEASERYWGLIACTAFGGDAFGDKAESFLGKAREMAHHDDSLLVRVRAAEFLAIVALDDPRPVIMDSLAQTRSGIEASLILNSAVLLRDGEPGYDIEISQSSVAAEVAKSQDVARRLSYFTAEDGVPKNPRGK